MPDTSSRTVHVELAERSYDIEIGSGILPRVVEFMAARSKLAHVVLMTDTNVDPLVGEPVAEYFTEEGIELEVMVIDAGEASKCADVAADLWESMLDEGADRQSVVVAVGGGVVGDLAGFIAATFTRVSTSFRFPPRSSRRSIAPSAEKWASISPRPRTWSALSGNQRAC